MSYRVGDYVQALDGVSGQWHTALLTEVQRKKAKISFTDFQREDWKTLGSLSTETREVLSRDKLVTLCQKAVAERDDCIPGPFSIRRVQENSRHALNTYLLESLDARSEVSGIVCRRLRDFGIKLCGTSFLKLMELIVVELDAIVTDKDLVRTPVPVRLMKRSFGHGCISPAASRLLRRGDDIWFVEDNSTRNGTVQMNDQFKCCVLTTEGNLVLYEHLQKQPEDSFILQLSGASFSDEDASADPDWALSRTCEDSEADETSVSRKRKRQNTKTTSTPRTNKKKTAKRGAVWKMYRDIIKKLGKNTIDSSTPEIPELKTLWESCSSSNAVVSETSGQALVKLVVNKKADYTFVMNSLLNLVPSARSLRGIVPAVGDLLVLQAEAVLESGQLYRCPYTIRSPPHPFITVLTNRPDSWLLLQQQVYSICVDRHRIHDISVKTIAPFLQFVFLEPQQSTEYQPIRIGLQRALIDVCLDSEESCARKVISFLVSTLHFSQIENYNDLAHLVQFLLDILRTCCRLPQTKENGSDLSRLLTFCLDLLQPCWTVGINTTRLERAVLISASKYPQALCKEENIACLAELLLLSPSHRCLELVQLVSVLLDSTPSCCPHLAAMLVLPLLQVLSAPPTDQGVGGTLKGVMVAAADALTKLELRIRDTRQDTIEQTAPRMPSCSPAGYSNMVLVSLAKLFSTNSNTAHVWLENITANITGTSSVPHNITNMVAALLIVPATEQVTRAALQAVVQVAKADLSQAPSLLPLLLYRLGREHDPEMKLTLMEAIPGLATHKVCVAPVLKTLQLMSGSSRLTAVSIRLMTDLWRIQDRTFPHLLKLLTDQGGRVVEGGVDEVVLARAAAIRDVCLLRPAQHGGDLLSPISEILNTHVGEEGAAACALALEGLAALCAAEVINIRSAWTVLAVKLSQDSRPIVVERICQLFALVPTLAENTPEFETFQQGTVRNLWLYCHSGNPTIQGAALRALAAFNPEHFRVSFLPAQVTSDFCEQAALIATQQENPDLTVDDILTFVPGICYIRLLKTLANDVLDDYEAFLSSMLAKEVESLPRGIYHSSLRRQGAAANQGKAVSKIPGFILAQYQKTNQPGLRPGLAAGLLFCYDPPVEVGRDGRPRRHYIVSHGKNYRQMFNTLLSEVPVQPSEWHRSMLMPQAWTSFLDRLFTAMLESRKAELELEAKRGDLDESEAATAQISAWLWVRDAVADMIKAASRGNPTMQGNSVLALAGLAVAVSRHVTGLDEETLQSAEDTCQHLSHSHWLTVAMDTIMCLIEMSFKPKGKILGLCQQRTAGDRLPASLLARSAACVSLSQLVPIFITIDSDRIYQVIAMLSARLPGQPGCEESPVLQFHYGFGLGMFLGRLFEEHISDVGGSKGMLEIWKALDVFENTCLSPEFENRAGAILGLGLTISGMCEEGKTESRAHVSSMHEKLLNLWTSTPPGDSTYQAMCVAVSCISGRAFAANILQVERVNSVVDVFTQAHLNNLEVMGICLALGSLCYNLSKVGHPTIGQLRTKLVGDWMKALASEETPPRQKISSLNGLLALIGSERSLVAVHSTGSSLLGSDLDVDGVIKLASTIAATSGDLGIQSNSAWMLGHLYLSACAVTETRASVPPSYSYLPEHSILRPLVDLLIEAGKRGPEFIPKEYVKLTLTAIQQEVKQILPPVNWAGVLSPFMRINFGDEVQRLCFKIAVSQSQTAPTAAMFVSSWLTPPLFNSLKADCKTYLYQSLPYLIKSVAPAILKSFLEHGCLEPFQEGDHAACVSVLQGLSLALMVRDPPESVTNILYAATGVFYSSLGHHLQIEVYSQMAECLSNLPDDRFDQITLEDFSQSETFVKGTFIRCYLIANGHQPVALLNSCVDSIIHSQHQDKRLLVCLVAHCLHQMSLGTSEYTAPLPRCHWLLELLGHIHNIAVGNTAMPDHAPPRTQVMSVAVEIVAAAVCLWTSSTAGAKLGVEPRLFTSSVKKSSASRGDNWLTDLSVSLPEFVNLLPAYVDKLECEPWSQVLSKLSDWLLTLSQSSRDVLTADHHTHVTDSLMMLRHCKPFRKAVLWTSVFSEVV